MTYLIHIVKPTFQKEPCVFTSYSMLHSTTFHFHDNTPGYKATVHLWLGKLKLSDS
jgi:hypothetical protein